jgi:BirA family biotin operon repressor/biotin-[acetyl-CoA-carboxylase] ligase
VSSSVVQHLAGYLSATEIRSGEAIGAELGCSRTAVWKHVETLRQLGIEVHAITGQGYLLKEPLELLDKALILEALDPSVHRVLAGLEIEASLDSTNSALHRIAVEEQHATVILAEHQTSGRGRRGRHWYSPFGKNLYLSLGWKFEMSLSELGCLPLVVALSAAQALQAAGLKGHKVKWPNDLLLDGCKLCGCLVEVQGDAQGPCHAVLGVGINVQMPEKTGTESIDQPWTDLKSQLPDCSRNTLAALLVGALVRHMVLFAEQGFTPFRDHWEQLDGLKGQVIAVHGGSGPFQGTAGGIDERGALLLDTGTETLKLHSGEVSLSKTKI